jgi:hypothetical protein
VLFVLSLAGAPLALRNEQKNHRQLRTGPVAISVATVSDGVAAQVNVDLPEVSSSRKCARKSDKVHRIMWKRVVNPHTTTIWVRSKTARSVSKVVRCNSV